MRRTVRPLYIRILIPILLIAGLLIACQGDPQNHIVTLDSGPTAAPDATPSHPPDSALGFAPGDTDSPPPDAAPNRAADASAPSADSTGASDTATPDSGPEPFLPSPGTGGTGGISQGVASGTCGARPYRAYIPANAGLIVPAPLVIATHGLGDTYDNFFQVASAVGWQAAANAKGFIFMVPAHQNPDRPSFLHVNGQTLDWPATRAELDSVMDCALNGLGALWNVDPARLFWIGFSEGGATADLAAYHFNPTLKGAAPYSGAVPGKVFPIPGAPRIFTVCGLADSAITHVQDAHQEWTDAGLPTQSAWVPGVGHTFSALNLQGPHPAEVFAWLDAAQAPPNDPPPPDPTPIGALDPPANQSSQGQGGPTANGDPQTTPTGVSYRLIAPANSQPRPLLVVYSGTEGALLMTQNLMQLAPAFGLGDAVIGILDGVQYHNNPGAGAAVLDHLRGLYNIDNDRTYLLSESAGTSAGLALAFDLRPSFFAAVWANDLVATATPTQSSAQLGFQPWGNAGPGGNAPMAQSLVAAMLDAGYRTAPPSPYNGPGASTHGSPEQFMAAIQWFKGRSRQ